MAQDFKRTLLRLLAFTPEVTQGKPNYKFTGSGGTSTTITLSTAGGEHNPNLATMADGFLNEMYVVFDAATTTAALRGKIYRVIDSARVTTTVTLTTPGMAASPLSGDIFYVFAPLQASNVSISFGKENLARNNFERLTLDMPSSQKGLSKVSGSFDLEFWGLEQKLGSADVPRPDRLSRLLEGIGSQRRVAGTTVSGSGSTTTVVDVTSAASIALNDFVMIGGEVRRVTAIDTGASPQNITVTPPFSVAPADATEVFMGEITTPYDSDHQSFTILHYRDSQLVACLGAILSMSLEANFSENISASFEFDADDYTLTDDQILDGVQATKKTLPYIEGETYFSTTELCVNSLSFTLGHGRQILRDSCVGQRVFVTTRDAQLSVTFRNKDAVPKNTWEASGTQAWLVAQIGNEPSDAVVIAGYAQIQDPMGMSDVEGHEFYDSTFGFRDDHDATNPLKPLIVRF